MSDRRPPQSVRPDRRRRPLEALEPRVLLAANWVGPSEREQQMLALINRFRQHPAQELPLLLNSSDPGVQVALDFFGVDRQTLAAQWAQLAPAPPLAWNAELTDAAYLHNLRMIKYDRQAHDLPGETPLVERTAAAGYADGQFVGENVYAYMQSVDHAHAGFAIDWGYGPGGIQDPAGHRDNLMAGVYREVGISITDTLANKTVGPYLVTQDFGVRRDQTGPFLLGTVYTDLNADGYYTPGEGAAGATVTAAGANGTFSTTTMSAGGYQMNLPPGVYSLTVRGGGMNGVATLGSVTVSIDNVQRDVTAPQFTPDATPPAPVLVAPAPGPEGGAASYTFDVTWSDDAGLDSSSLSSGDLLVTGPDGFSAYASLLAVGPDTTGNNLARTATYRVVSPGWSFDAADNGVYTISVVANEVADVYGNAAPAQTLGTYTVNVPAVWLGSNGLLNVTGTAADDSIALAITSSRGRSYVQVTVNGDVTTVRYRSIARINVQGLAGDDVITLDRDLIGTSVDAGDGHDIVYGTVNSDYLIGGDGDDILYGFAGKDYIVGGLGYDRAYREAKAVAEGIEKFLRKV